MKIKLLPTLLALAVTAMLSTAVPAFAQEATPVPSGTAPVTTGVDAQDERQDRDAKPETDERPTRRGIFGEAARVGDASLVLTTKWGDIEVLVTGATVFKNPAGDATLAAIEPGTRLAVLLDRAPTDPDTGATGLRTVTALQIHVVPAKPQREHKRAVVSRTCNEDGTISVVNEDGTETEVEADCDRDKPEAGEDRIMLLRQEAKDRAANARLRVVASERAGRVTDRLRDIAERTEDTAKRALVEEIRSQATERNALRLEEVEAKLRERASDQTVKAREALTRARSAAEAGRVRAQQARDAARSVLDRLPEAQRGDAADRIRDAADRIREAEQKKREAARARISDFGLSRDVERPDTRPTPTRPAAGAPSDGRERPTPTPVPSRDGTTVR